MYACVLTQVIVSSVPWSTRAGKAVDDSWRVYGHERRVIFDAIARADLRGVLLLSGDLHWSAVFVPRPGLTELSVSPLFAFPLPRWTGSDTEAPGDQVSMVDDWGLQHAGQLTFVPAGGQDSQGRVTEEAQVEFTLWGWRWWWDTPTIRHQLVLPLSTMRLT
jgi:hypothetical protein